MFWWPDQLSIVLRYVIIQVTSGVWTIRCQKSFVWFVTLKEQIADVIIIKKKIELQGCKISWNVTVQFCRKIIIFFFIVSSSSTFLQILKLPSCKFWRKLLDALLREKVFIKNLNFSNISLPSVSRPFLYAGDVVFITPNPQVSFKRIYSWWKKDHFRYFWHLGHFLPPFPIEKIRPQPKKNFKKN